jgi:3-oxoacyl-[acyl-carrier protein] reductase
MFDLSNKTALVTGASGGIGGAIAKALHGQGAHVVLSGTRAVLRNMMKKRWGRIVTITSVVGVTGNPGQANYAAAKAGLIGMTKALAAEIASRNITVNCVAPGFIATAMTDALTSDQKTAILARIPAGRLGESKDVAAAVVYLASEEAHYVTGQTLHVNGGMAMV